MREGVGNYLAPAKEFYGEGATGFGVSGPRGLPGDGHGGGGQQGLHHLDHERKNKLDLKLPKQEVDSHFAWCIFFLAISPLVLWECSLGCPGYLKN